MEKQTGEKEGRGGGFHHHTLNPLLPPYANHNLSVSPLSACFRTIWSTHTVTNIIISENASTTLIMSYSKKKITFSVFSA